MEIQQLRLEIEREIQGRQLLENKLKQSETERHCQLQSVFSFCFVSFHAFCWFLIEKLIISNRKMN